jgi:hypothetical protein
MIEKTAGTIELESGIDRFSFYKTTELDGLVKKVIIGVANVFISLGNFFCRLFSSPIEKKEISQEVVQVEPQDLLKNSMEDLVKGVDSLYLKSIQYQQTLNKLNPDIPLQEHVENTFDQAELSILKTCFFDAALNAYKKEWKEIHSTEISKKDIQEFRALYIETIDQIAEDRIQNASLGDLENYKKIIKMLK